MPLDEKYWDERYKNQATAWDIGDVSTPLKEYIDQLNDKNISILIPGCGNAWEAEYLLKNGFTNVTLIDISPALAEKIRNKLSAYAGSRLKIICADFFKLEQQFDLVLEQTFFCALDPAFREEYIAKMNAILKPGGKLAGVLFNRSFEGGPPFGGNKAEYEKLFLAFFEIRKMETCYNSIEKRKGSEVFFILKKL